MEIAIFETREDNEQRIIVQQLLGPTIQSRNFRHQIVHITPYSTSLLFHQT